MKNIHLYKYILSIVMFLFCTKQSIGQEKELLQKQVSFSSLTVDQGLSQNSLVSIAQDSTGFMWFATQDGLNKYDGKSFTYYDRQFEDVTRPSYSKLGKVYIDKEGQIWIISISGVLEKYDSNLDTFHKVPNIKNASTIFQSRNKNLFVGTYGGGIFKINPSSKDTIDMLRSNLKPLDSYDILESPEEVLVATSKGILKISTNTFCVIETMGFEQTAFSSLEIDSSNTIYAGSFGEGLFIKKNEAEGFSQFLGFGTAPFPENMNIQDLLVDKQDRLWVATYGKGAYLIDFKKKSLQNFTVNKDNPYALRYNDVLCLYEDFTEIIWLGTDGNGLSYYDKHLVKFNLLTNRQTPPNVNIDVIRCISVNGNTIWVGTSGKGLTKINLKTKEFKTYTDKNSSLLGNRIMSLLYEKDNLWIGHQNDGLQVMNLNGTIKTIKETEDLTIWKIVKADKNLIWLCTRSQGLLLFDENKGISKRFNSANTNLTTNNIRTVTKGDSKTLWIGTEDQGLFKLDLNSGVITKIEAVPDNIKCLFYSKNLLWVGTNGNGLKLYDVSEKMVHSYTKKNGLPNNVIYGILPDGQKNLWLSSNKGLTKFSINSNYRPTIENYSNYDGLQAFEYNTGAYFKDENGTLYFGGLEGINWFQPNQLTFNPKKPKTVIIGLKVFNKEIDIVQHQEFPSEQNTFTFSFSSLHFSQPERNQYKYRLINNDDEWISSGNNNIAHYTNLPPNEYSFQVVSSNYDGVWNNKPATYSFTILKPWYTTNLARALYFLCVLLLMYGVYAYLKWRWHVKNQLRLEHEETERLKKLDELKTKLYANISHEIRTPLTLISGPLENQLRKETLTKEDKKDLTLIKQNSNRLLRLVNQMLDLSLVDSGELKLCIENGNLSIFLKQLLNIFQYKANKKGITIITSVKNLENCWFDKDIIEKVVSNLLSNALKYAPQNTIINIDANNDNGWFIFSIINNKGALNIEHLNQLFNRFYQDNDTSDGVGVGLALVKELVNLSKGNIIANTVDESSVQFTVSLPITKESFNSNEIVFNEPVLKKTVPTRLHQTNQDKPILLIVEDNREVRSFIVSNLIETYQIIEAENGQTGIEKAQKHLPDLIISDIMMPVKNGIELCNTIKTNELTSHIPVILLTAKVGEQNEIEGFKTGADAYFTKPFSPEKLQIRVEKLIETRRKLQDYFSKTFTIDPDLGITSTETDFLNRLQTVLDKHITDPELTSEAFSKLMYVSRTQLHRKLNSIVGMSTTAFIRSQRMKIACRLLKETDVTVSEITYEVGFNSVSYFIKCFKKTYGCAPIQYRTKHI